MTKVNSARDPSAQSHARTPRPYDAPRRRAQAQATRAAIVAAARRLLVANGWSGTRVRDVAQEAGVSEPTVYAAYGSKAGLALALLEAIETGAERTRALRELRRAAGDPRRQLAALVAFDRRLFERAGDVIGTLRDAGAAEPQLREAYAQGRARGDAARRETFGSWPAGTLRPGADATLAADTYAALCSIDVYRTLTDERGWSPAQVERWWRESLERLLLA